MREKIYNNETLTSSDIDEVVTRVKVFLVNSNNELLIAKSGGGCQLPGGHREENEELYETVLREVQEETGIVLSREEIIDSFFKIKHLTRNYKDTGLNRCSEMVYFYVKSDKNPDISNINLTESEKCNNFTVEKIRLEDAEDYVNNFINSSSIERNVIIAREIQLALREFKEYLYDKDI